MIIKVRIQLLNTYYIEKKLAMVNVSEREDDEDLPSYKVIILGKAKAGKTKLLARYKFGTYDDKSIPTLGVDFLQINRSKAVYKYYDTAGQDKYRAIVKSYYRDSDACIIAYDTSSISSFEEV